MMQLHIKGKLCYRELRVPGEAICMKDEPERSRKSNSTLILANQRMDV